MSQKPDKTPAQAEQSPATGAELTWIAVLLALCLMAKSFLVGTNPEPMVKKSAPVSASAVPSSAIILAPERPGRDRPDVNRERPWRDPASSALPGC